MKYLEKDDLKNNFLYFLSSAILYSMLYLFLSLKLKDFYNPYIGIITLILSVFIDYYLSKKKIRIYIRFIIVVIITLLVHYSISFLSLMASPSDRYNIFDKIPYIFRRDILISTLFILGYFVFDSSRIKKNNKTMYFFSTLFIIFLFTFVFYYNTDISKTIYKNYFNYSISIIIVIFFIVIRHIAYNENLLKKKFKKKDFLLLLLLFIPLIFFLFSITLQRHMNQNNKGNSALFNQNLFNFDFSDYIELKEEIKMSKDRVLIMELSGLDQAVSERINKGWNRQIYLKRFSLEEYTPKGNFKMADKFLDPNSSPTFLSGYMWESKNIPNYKDRISILEQLYLINIDSSSLLGSELLTKIIPVTNWSGSPYKQIYKSFCLIPETNVSRILFSNPGQKKFLSELHPERKKLLLNWGDEKKNQKIKELAESITLQYDNVLYKTLAVQQFLLDEYFYSLKPGLSKGTNQLEYFLFDSKKGYCSYFAFAMTLLLRSVGIASRVAVGFAPDMENKTMNFYEIRSIDGHAWVEVYIDDFGWLTFDPTSSNFAEGEFYDFALKNDEERNDLIEEILKNKDKMNDITKKLNEAKNFIEDVVYTIKNSVRLIGFVLLLMLIIVFLFLIIIKKNINLLLFKISKNHRNKIKYLFVHYMGKLLDLGYPIRREESLLEYSDRIITESNINLLPLTKLYQKALFSKSDFYNENVDLNLIKISLNNDIKKLPSKIKVFSFFNMSRLWKKILPVILLIVLSRDIFSQNNIDYNIPDYIVVDKYIMMANQALDESYYDKAIAILNKAEEKFPDSYKPNYRKGKIYSSYELNESALIELLKAKKKGMNTEDMYTEIANCYGKIGENKKAVQIYEEAFQKLYKTMELYDNLGWMYFKIHELDKGIALIKEGLEKYPKSSDLLMTLGTLYSEAWDYQKSKFYYLESVEKSFQDFKSSSFRSIALYNLALLEHSFLYFENSFNSAKAAISNRDRSSPHMQLGYLYMSALELKDAYNEILKASQMEPKTLFPEMSLVRIYLLSGKVDQSIELLKSLLANTDFSWMLYFGTNKDAYYSELYRGLFSAYEAKANIIRFNEERNIKNNITRPFRRIYYITQSILYNFRYTNLIIKIGEEKIKGGSSLEGLHQLYDAYERIWPSKALKILKLTEEIELKSIPNKQKNYNIYKAILRDKSSPFYSGTKKVNDLKNNIPFIDKRWEKNLLTDALVEIIKSTKSNEKKHYSNYLFLTHPPLIPLNNFKIRMNISVYGDLYNKKEKNNIIKMLRLRGIINDKSSNISLQIDCLSDKSIIVNVFNEDIFINNHTINLNNYNDIDELTREIFNSLFIINLD